MTGADLARRLAAAAEGASYEDGLTSDDAEISDLEKEDAQPAAGPSKEQHAAEMDEDSAGQAGQDNEEDVDIMNSPLPRPWGAEVRGCRPLLCWL